jgi:tRNA(Ile)-lysidine synthase
VDDTPALVLPLARYFGPSDNGLVIAVSGGADSVALARAAVLARSRGTCKLVLAHLNHRLRGGESDADEAFVVALAAQLPEVAVCCARIDVAGEAARSGENLEATARAVRYDWLAKVARERGIAHVATGHTADDQAETVLHRLLRGAGLQGLRGIAARRPLAPDVELVRPMLGVTRAEVLAFLQALGQPFREDSSNRDLRFTRNRIRHELLPLLASQYNSAIVKILGRLAEQADEAFREEEAAAAALLAEAELPRAGRQIVLNAARLAAVPARDVRALLRHVWERENWSRDAMGFEAWQRVTAVARAEAKAVDLPGGIHACHRGRVVVLGPRDPG